MIPGSEEGVSLEAEFVFPGAERRDSGRPSMIEPANHGIHALPLPDTTEIPTDNTTENSGGPLSTRRSQGGPLTDRSMHPTVDTVRERRDSNSSIGSGSSGVESAHPELPQEYLGGPINTEPGPALDPAQVQVQLRDDKELTKLVASSSTTKLAQKTCLSYLSIAPYESITLDAKKSQNPYAKWLKEQRFNNQTYERLNLDQNDDPIPLGIKYEINVKYDDSSEGQDEKKRKWKSSFIIFLRDVEEFKKSSSPANTTPAKTDEEVAEEMKKIIERIEEERQSNFIIKEENLTKKNFTEQLFQDKDIELSQHKVTVKRIALDSKDKPIIIGDCKIDKLHFIDLDTNVNSTRIFLSELDFEKLEEYKKMAQEKFIVYFLQNNDKEVADIFKDDKFEITPILSSAEHASQRAVKAMEEAFKVIKNQDPIDVAMMQIMTNAVEAVKACQKKVKDPQFKIDVEAGLSPHALTTDSYALPTALFRNALLESLTQVKEALDKTSSFGDDDKFKKLALTIQRAQFSVAYFAESQDENHVAVSSAYAKFKAEGVEAFSNNLKDNTIIDKKSLPTREDLEEATRKAIEATNIHVKTKIAEHIDSAKITRKKDGKANEIKIEYGKFSKDLENLNLYVGKDSNGSEIYAQLKFKENGNVAKVNPEVKYFRKNSTDSSFDEIRDDIDIIKKTKITVKIQSDPKEKTFIGRSLNEEKESYFSSFFSQRKKPEKTTIIDLGAIYKKDDLWKIGEVLKVSQVNQNTQKSLEIQDALKSIAIKRDSSGKFIFSSTNDPADKEEDTLKRILKNEKIKIITKLKDNDKLYTLEINEAGKINVIEETRIPVAMRFGVVDRSSRDRSAMCR